MKIHVVQQGDTIQSIAELYGISAFQLIRDNGLDPREQLVIGQSLVIVIPELTYTVKDGDTLIGIANSHNVTIMQLLQNNPYLSERAFIFPGDEIVISYNKIGTIVTHGHTVPYINKTTLKQTLPYLTYLSVLNYTATDKGEIISYYDDTEIIHLAVEYDVIPLMLLTTLTLQGDANIRTAYELLLNDDYQNTLAENLIEILRTKGYYGASISFEYVSVSNMQFVESYYAKLSKRLNEEGFLVFAIINPNIDVVGDSVRFARVDFSLLGKLSHNIIFMNYQWAKTTNPPSPISSVYNIDAYLNYLTEFVPPDKLIIGLATIGYDWELPYSAGVSSVYSLSLNRAVELARSVGAVIQFDEISQTPFFQYAINRGGISIEHIVWFIDARSINALLELVSKYELGGTAIWNLTLFNHKLWLIINSQYEIIKSIR